MSILVHHEGQPLGPYTEEEARAALLRGQLRASDLAWQEGSPSWVPLSTVLALAGAPPMLPVPFDGDRAGLPTPVSALAITSFVLGILSIVSCAFITGIPAIVCGHLARARIREARNTLAGDGLALTGLITGYVGTAIIVVMTLVMGVSMAAMLAVIPLAGAGKLMLDGPLQSRSQAQAEIIAKACQRYASGHEGAYPESLEALVEEHLLSRTDLRDPNHSPPETASSAAAAGYLYYGQGAGPDTPTDTVLLASKALYEGRHVLAHLDGTTELGDLPP